MDTWNLIQKTIADIKVAEDLRDKLEDVKDAHKTAKDDLEQLRYSEREAVKSTARYSKELSELYEFIIKHNLNLTEIGIELDTLFGV